MTWETAAGVSVPRDQAEPRLAAVHPGAGVLGAGQGAHPAGHREPDDLLGLVVDDEVPRGLEPHGGAGGPGGVQTLGPGTFIPSGGNITFSLVKNDF